VLLLFLCPSFLFYFHLYFPLYLLVSMYRSVIIHSCRALH
jgi:hypothetical protein